MDETIDVARLMDEVRERVATKRAAGLYGDDPADVELALDGPLERLAARAAIAGRRDVLVSSAAGVGPALTLARRASVKAVAPFLEDLLLQINTFHFETVGAFQRLEEELERANARIRELERRLDEPEQRS